MRRRVVDVKCVLQSGEQVVVTEDFSPPLANLQFGQNVFREVHTHGGARIGIGAVWPQFGRGVFDDLACQVQRVGVAQQWIVTFLAEVAEVEVVDELGDQFVEALHQRHTGVGIARDTEGFEDHLAELVGGGDRRGVERRKRVAQALLA